MFRLLRARSGNGILCYRQTLIIMQLSKNVQQSSKTSKLWICPYILLLMVSKRHEATTVVTSNEIDHKMQE